MAQDIRGAFIETFGQLAGIGVVTQTALDRRRLSWVRAMRPIDPVDLTGAGLALLGADQRLAAGEHGIAQRWSLAHWRHPTT